MWSGDGNWSIQSTGVSTKPRVGIVAFHVPTKLYYQTLQARLSRSGGDFDPRGGQPESEIIASRAGGWQKPHLATLTVNRRPPFAENTRRTERRVPCDAIDIGT